MRESWFEIQEVMKYFSYYCVGHTVNPLNAKLNPICHLLALLGTHHILHVSGVIS